MPTLRIPQAGPVFNPGRPVQMSINLIATIAINAKHSALGGNAGVLGVPTDDKVRRSPDGVGFFRGFVGGMIYWRPSTNAFEVHGAILQKWASLSFERGFLGYPVSDETATPDGLGRFTRFERGVIYWSPATGAQEVHGGILERWAQLGSERSWLGYPTSDELDFAAHPEIGRVSSFQNGEIYWWPDTGAIELNNVIVHYTGLRCFGETDWDQGSTSDEPYCIFTVASPTGTSVMRSRVYTDVDAGDTRPDLLEIYLGKPNGLVIGTKLFEHDEEDPDKYKEDIKNGVHEAFEAAKVAINYIPLVGPGIAKAGGPLLTKLEAPVAAALNDVLDLGDDELGEAVSHISPKQMVLLATRTQNSVHYDIGFKLETSLMTGEGASYKAYFGLVPG